MMIARWSVEAKFGQKQVVIDMLNSWIKDIGSQVGFSPDKLRLYTGSIGALESTLQAEYPIDNLAKLDEAWAKLAQNDAHKAWGKELGQFVVSGSSRWEIFRVLS